MKFALQRTSTQGKEGFTLVEVMIGFGLFAIVMTSVMWMMILSQRIGQAARNRMEALQHARATMEDLLSLQYDHEDLAVGRHVVWRGGFRGVYRVSEPDLGERKRIRLSFRYDTFNDTANVDLRMDITEALH